MSDGEFEYVPYVTTPHGEWDAQVCALWDDFLDYRRHLDRVREDFTGHPFKSGAHELCTRSERRPELFAFVKHHDRYGTLTHSTVHPNLLAPDYFGDGRLADQTSLVIPGVFPNEIGAAA